MKEILYTVAKKDNGELVTASNADKGTDFFCPVCNSNLLLRKSGNTGKNSKRPHFAHKTLTPNCTPETALHFAFKNLLAEKLQKKLNENIPLEILWDCKECDGEHSGNLLKRIKSIKVEYNLTIAQPDIALLDKDNKVFAVIEIVVTHKPEGKVLQYYKDSNIILIQITLTSDNDIENLEHIISKPGIVNTCLNPKCSKCGRSQHKTIMTIVDAPCWKCNSTMKVAFYRLAGVTIDPSGFTPDEIEFARNKGVVIKNKYSKTSKKSYLANTCNNCGTFIGENYLFKQYAAPASFGDLLSTDYEIGYHCEHCKELEMYGQAEK